MAEMKISELKEFQDREVILKLADGETLRALTSFVDRKYEDIIVDILDTDRPDTYKTPGAAYTIPASDILSVTIPNACQPD
jgi:hypothetical protein